MAGAQEGDRYPLEPQEEFGQTSMVSAMEHTTELHRFRAPIDQSDIKATRY
jgi:hypothetical protein